MNGWIARRLACRGVAVSLIVLAAVWPTAAVLAIGPGEGFGPAAAGPVVRPAPGRGPVIGGPGRGGGGAPQTPPPGGAPQTPPPGGGPKTPPPGPAQEVPELSPGAAAAALTLLVGVTLILVDRMRLRA